MKSLSNKQQLFVSLYLEIVMYPCFFYSNQIKKNSHTQNVEFECHVRMIGDLNETKNWTEVTYVTMDMITAFKKKLCVEAEASI